MQLSFVASVVEAATSADFDVLLAPSGGHHDRSFERIVCGGWVDGLIPWTPGVATCLRIEPIR
ncbi:MAG: hypothetical protein QG671_177 [Actinomycetota bacterium]|nr:hypothetical protein [Actinomycetota bacterium]